MLNTRFIEHLAVNFNTSSEEVSKVVNSFSDPTPQKKQLPPKKSHVPDKHSCERIPRGKSEPCGKVAKKCVDEDEETYWYCGTESSGCYKSIIGSTKRQVKAAASKTSSKNPTLQNKKSVANNQSESLIHSVTSTKGLDIKPIKVNDQKLWIDHN